MALTLFQTIGQRRTDQLHLSRSSSPSHASSSSSSSLSYSISFSSNISSSSSSSSRRKRSRCYFSIISGLLSNNHDNDSKPKTANHTNTISPSFFPSTNTTTSPLKAAEELAAHLGFEMAIAGLERLFRQGAQPPDPADPTHPGRRPVRVAYQGVRGSYCQEAAAAAFPASPCYEFSLVPCAQMEDAFSSLEDRTVDRAFIPIENSIDGTIPRNLDLLLRHPDIRITGELQLPVEHCLLALPTASASSWPSSLRRVVSHPQALAHCRDHLRSLGLEVEEAESAAGAAQFVAENRMEDTAVIGSKAAAQEFGLQIVERNFQDQTQENRFLKLKLASALELDKMEVEGGRGAPRTTVAFSLGKGPSDLYRVLWSFESRGVSVTRFEHRPNRSRPIRIGQRNCVELDFMFLVEVDGRQSDHAVRSALARLHDVADFVRVLGSYNSTSPATT